MFINDVFSYLLNFSLKKNFHFSYLDLIFNKIYFFWLIRCFHLFLPIYLMMRPPLNHSNDIDHLKMIIFFCYLNKILNSFSWIIYVKKKTLSFINSLWLLVWFDEEESERKIQSFIIGTIFFKNFNQMNKIKIFQKKKKIKSDSVCIHYTRVFFAFIEMIYLDP